MDITTLSEKDLFGFLKFADNNYHNGQPIISDNEYDNIRDFSFSKYPDNEYFLTVGAPIQKSSKNKKVTLKYTLGSLKKIKAEQNEELNRWLLKHKGKKIVVSAKLDGISVFIENKDEEFFACTRGDGKEGFDITSKVSNFISVKNIHNYEVRGEIVWCGEEYKEYNFANRRNAVSGIINSTEGTHSEKLTFIAHEIINSNIKTEHGRMKKLEELGFKIPHLCVIDTSITNINSELLVKILEDYKGLYTNIIDIDGLVLCADDSERENVYYPEKKVAFKLNDEFQQGVVDKIVWSVNRTGKIVPVVYFKEKLLLSGAYVEKATAHNYKFIKDNGLGEGAIVSVTRSGEVIPYISNVIKKAQLVCEIKVCPCCDNKLTLSKTLTDLICSNSNCSDQVFNKIEHFIKSMDIPNISIQTIKNLKLNSIEHVYNIDVNYILQFDGFASKSAKKLIDSIKNSLVDVKPSRFIKALGIEGLGERNAEKLLNSLGASIDPIEGFFELSYNNIINVDGFGDILAENIIKEKSIYYNTLYRFFKNKGITFKKKVVNSNKTSLTDKNVIMTGGYTINRVELEEMITNNGGVVQSSVNKKTNILVCDTLNSDSSKMKKALELNKKGCNIVIIMYGDFIDEYLN